MEKIKEFQLIGLGCSLVNINLNRFEELFSSWTAEAAM